MTNSRLSLAGAGGLSPTCVIVRVRMVAVVQTDTTIGAGRPARDGEDIAIVRDTVSGRPMWPGTSQAGALRRYLSLQLGAHVGDEVFGNDSRYSAVFTTDALAFPPDTMTAEAFVGARTSNRHDEQRAVVAQGAVYDMEALEPGARFFLDLAMHLPKDTASAELLAKFMVGLQGLEQGQIRVGLRKTKGRGQIRAHLWSADIYDLGDTTDLKRWLCRERAAADWELDEWKPCLDLDGVVPIPTVIADWRAEFTKLLKSSSPNQLALRVRLENTEHVGNSNGKYVTTLSQTARLLPGVPGKFAVTNADGTSRNPGTVPIERKTARFDGQSVTVGEVPIYSGEAFHSQLKRAARWALAGVVDSLDSDKYPHAQQRSADVLRQLFGGLAPASQAPVPSRVAVSEGEVTNTSYVNLPRVAIDPLTQGAVNGSLHSETVLLGGSVSVDVRLTKPLDYEIGLLFLALRDLNDGLVRPFGGGGGRGHGRQTISSDDSQVLPSGNGMASPGWKKWNTVKYQRENLVALLNVLKESAQ